MDKLADTLDDVKQVADSIDEAVASLVTESAEEIAILKELAERTANEVDPAARQALKDQMVASAQRIADAVAALDAAGKEVDPSPEA